MASVERIVDSWRVVWREQGRKEYERFDTRPEAEHFQSLVEAHGNHWPHGWVKGHGFNTAPSNAPLFGDWAVRAISSRSRASARTRHDYTRDYTTHLADTFATTPIDRITREQVGNWLITISRSGVSQKTVKNIHNLASSIVADAISAQLASHNPFRSAFGSLPKVLTEEMVFLSRAEFDQLAGGVQEWFRPLVRLLALTGLRWSEATALQVGDVDVRARRLRVVRAWKRTPESYFVIGEPKSVRSRRTIALPPSLVEELLPLVVGRDPGAWLFLSRQGRPVRHANFRNRVWLPAVAAVNACTAEGGHGGGWCDCPSNLHKRPRIHDLRHSHASWLIAAGVPLPAIQRRLGHESIQTTIDRYGHLAPELDDVISAALDGPGLPDSE